MIKIQMPKTDKPETLFSRRDQRSETINTVELRTGEHPVKSGAGSEPLNLFAVLNIGTFGF
ncbi:MAG: hypothetical protein CVU57_23310 [Deltaproteobacteria bacterium HGW-Deltaproteobacteria-15]|jgi:hypothetical protein|nr:MAG: hypothetical protein CVU57_23310 [Deltaproteobacteria bacterium HGW-Deltaproteobacteria-15]